MRNKKKIFIGIGAFLVLMFVSVFIYTLFGGTLQKNKSITSNSGRDSAVTSPPAMPSPDFGVAEEADDSKGVTGGVGQATSDQDKIIGTYSMNFETLDFPKMIIDVTGLVTKYTGYVQSSSIYNNTSNDGKLYKYATYVFRIPKDKVIAFNAELKNFANITTESSSQENVTKYYRDTQARLTTLEAQQKRLNELFAQAKEIADIIEIETRLNEIIYQIEMIKGELQYLDERVDYSTIYVNIQEVSKLSTGESIQASLGERLQLALKQSAELFKESMINFLILLIYVIPFAIVIGILGFFGLKIFRRARRKSISSKNIDKPIDSSNENKN
ncbi:MAG: DUF4349 domain-containing protein [Clostridiaceae bacterium]